MLLWEVHLCVESLSHILVILRMVTISFLKIYNKMFLKYNCEQNNLINHLKKYRHETYSVLCAFHKANTGCKCRCLKMYNLVITVEWVSRALKKQIQLLNHLQTCVGLVIVTIFISCWERRSTTTHWVLWSPRDAPKTVNRKGVLSYSYKSI